MTSGFGLGSTLKKTAICSYVGWKAWQLGHLQGVKDKCSLKGFTKQRAVHPKFRQPKASTALQRGLQVATCC